MKKIWIAVLVIAGAIVLAGTGVLIWFLVRSDAPYETIQLEGGLGDVPQRAGFTRIPNTGEVFWWFYPRQADSSDATTRPIILWLDGVTDLPSSLSANVGMFGPYDFNMNRRNDSWVEDYNLLFIDAPIGRGFSIIDDENKIPVNVEENAEHLFLTLDSFYSVQSEYSDTPLYIFGQGHGAQLALYLAIRLQEEDAYHISQNLKGIALGNGVISPGLVMTKLGFYLEELAYVSDEGREVLEILASETQDLITAGDLEAAYRNFLSLGDIVNDRAGAVAVNLGHIVEKLTREPTRDLFGQKQHLKSISKIDSELNDFMDGVVAPALGIQRDQEYDGGRESVIEAFRKSYMSPSVSLIETILQTTNLTVTIYNGNLDAVSNTPGQLEWVESLQWDGQDEFLNSPRQLLVLNRQLEGYFKETERLKFFWINAAGKMVPLDSPVAMRRVLRGVAGY